MSQLHVVIGGYGRVGRYLAHVLEAEGHSVSVIDRNPDILEEIEDDIRGQKFTGEVFDREVLELAGIEDVQHRLMISDRLSWHSASFSPLRGTYRHGH